MVILEQATELDLVSVGWPHRNFHQPCGNLVSGISDCGARAVLVVGLRPIDRAAEYIDIRIDAHAAEDRSQPAILVGAVRPRHIDAPPLAGTNDVVDVLGAERHETADSARAVDVCGGAANHIHSADQFRIEEEGAVSIVAGALIILPCAVHHHRDTAEILQAADVDRTRRIVAAVLERHRWHTAEQIRYPLRLQPLNLLKRHDTHRRQRVDRTLFGFRRSDGNGIERLHRRRTDLRPRIEDGYSYLPTRYRLTFRLLGRLRQFDRLNRCRCLLRHTGARSTQCHRNNGNAHHQGARTPSPVDQHCPTTPIVSMCLLGMAGWRCNESSGLLAASSPHADFPLRAVLMEYVAASRRSTVKGAVYIDCKVQRLDCRAAAL